MDNKIKDILKVLVVYDVDKDFKDEESKKEFINYFSEIVQLGGDIGTEFLKKLIVSMKNILNDMNIKSTEPMSIDVIDDKDEKNKEDNEEDKEDDEEDDEKNESLILISNANRYL